MIIIMTDRYNCSGDYRDACTLVGQGLRHISLKSPRARRLYHFKLLLENGCLSRFVTHCYEQKSQELVNKTPKAKSRFDWISVDVSVTDRIWKLCSMTFKSLMFSICRPAIFLVLKFIDSYFKIISWQALLCFTTYPIFCLKNKFVPLLARRGSKLRCCELWVYTLLNIGYYRNETKQMECNYYTIWVQSLISVLPVPPLP